MYVELHAHSAYSFLDGASSPEELAAAAAMHGYGAVALTDHDGLYGSMEFAHACKGLGVKSITGAELTLEDERGRPAHLTLLAQDRTGYSNLCRLLTAAHAHTRANPRERTPPHATLAQVEQHAEGVVCLSGCARDGAAERHGQRLLAAFGRERFRIELQRPYWRRDRTRNRRLAQLAERLRVPCVATGNVHSHHRDRARLQDAFVAVRLLSALDQTEPQRRGNGDFGDGLPRRHGGAVRRPSRSGRGDGADRGADRVRPHARPRLPLPGRGGSRGRSQARRAVRSEVVRALSAQRRATGRHARGWTRSCA